MMLVAFLIMLREGLEAALIVGIMASYAVRRGQRGVLPSIWAGVVAAILASGAAGALLVWTGGEFPQRQQELFEAAIALLAIVILLSMVFWMRKAGQSFRSEIERSMESTLLAAGGAFSFGLFFTTFLIAGREGLESAMFLVAILQQAVGPALLIGALAGLLLAGLIGIAIFRLGVRIHLGRFFRVTGVFVIFVAAGLAASVLRGLHEAGVWNLLQGVAYDLSASLPTDGITGTFLAGILGYSATPTWGEVLAYLAILIPSLVLFLRPLPPRASVVAAA